MPLIGTAPAFPAKKHQADGTVRARRGQWAEERRGRLAPPGCGSHPAVTRPVSFAANMAARMATEASGRRTPQDRRARRPWRAWRLTGCANRRLRDEAGGPFPPVGRDRRLMACAIPLAWAWPRALPCLQQHPGHHVENHRVFDVWREALLDAAADGPRNHILMHATGVAGIERGKVLLHVWRKSQLSPGQDTLVVRLVADTRTTLIALSDLGLLGVAHGVLLA